MDLRSGFLLVISFQAEHKENGRLAALKQVALETEEDLQDLMVEIDILTECKHPNIVDLFEAYLYQDKLWVRAIDKSFRFVSMRILARASKQ